MKKKFFDVVKKYLYMILVIITAVAIAPGYGYTHYIEEKKEQEQLEKENQLIQDMLQSEANREEIIAGTSNKRPETGYVDKKEPENTIPDQKPQTGNTQQPGENTNAGNNNSTGDTGNGGNSGSSSSTGSTNGDLCMDVVRTGPTERTLFIGDSRTQGIQYWSHLTNIEYFAVQGVSVYRIWDETTEFAGLGKVGLAEILQNGTYANIHILLGINELGSPLDTTAQTYGQLIADIQKYQPDARIYISANMHVTKAKSDSNTVFTNDRINYLNSQLKKFADNEKIFYLDMNELFDDANGALNAGYTGDGVHLLPKYYIPWGQWLMEQFEKTK